MGIPEFSSELARLRRELVYIYHHGLGVEVLSREDEDTVDAILLDVGKEVFDCYARRALAPTLGVPIRGEEDED